MSKVKLSKEDLLNILFANKEQIIAESKIFKSGKGLWFENGHHLITGIVDDRVSVGDPNSTLNLVGNTARIVYWFNNIATSIPIPSDINNTAMCLKDGYYDRYSLNQASLVEGQTLYDNNYGVNSWCLVRISSTNAGTTILSLRNPNNLEILGYTIKHIGGETSSVLIPLATGHRIVVGQTADFALSWGDVTVVQTREV